ncbi:hypothetical protein [Streptomyces violaceus]|uniref:Uncharacterized protein n=1 Tax=Streptomyces violaceus TaxID=1936 RepID=A0ABY9U7E9_STRVL|nr:hypothetical protein [Streptomyces janthinus]WND18221.1 hypothetical protein RI060_13125 [Streptomyces janthinus]GGS74958.1 hypothetical protein GCM10010270_53400 [Streptomyces janthinus]
MQRTIRYDRRSGTLIFGDTTRPYRDVGFTLHATELTSIKATDFKAAMSSYLYDWEDGTVEVYVVEDDFDEFDDEYSTPGPVTFVQHRGSLLVRVALATKAHEDDDEGSPEPLYRSALVLQP